MCTNGRYTLFLDALAMGDAALQPGMESLWFGLPSHSLVTTLTELSLLFLLAMLNFVYFNRFNGKNSSNNAKSNGDACGWKRSWSILYYCSEFAETKKHHEGQQTVGKCIKITLVPDSNTAEIKNGGVSPPLPLWSITLCGLLGSAHGKFYFAFCLYLTEKTLDMFLCPKAFPLN